LEKFPEPNVWLHTGPWFLHLQGRAVYISLVVATAHSYHMHLVFKIGILLIRPHGFCLVLAYAHGLRKTRKNGAFNRRGSSPSGSALDGSKWWSASAGPLKIWEFQEPTGQDGSKRESYSSLVRATVLVCDRAQPGPRKLLLPWTVSASMPEYELFVLERRADGGGRGYGWSGRCEAVKGPSPQRREVD
jgi:hypothetical protein